MPPARRLPAPCEWPVVDRLGHRAAAAAAAPAMASTPGAQFHIVSTAAVPTPRAAPVAATRDLNAAGGDDGGDDDGAVQPDRTVRLYSLKSSSLDFVENEIMTYISKEWKVSKAVPVPKGGGVPFRVFEQVAIEVATVIGAEIVDVDRRAETFRIKVLGSMKLATAERDVVMRLNERQHEYVTERDAPPEYWEDQDDDIETFDVAADTPEFERVVENFKRQPAGSGLFECTVVAVDRVQHKGLWAAYIHERQKVAEQNGGDCNEILNLKHGTGNTPPSVIVNSEWGIDQRYSDKGMYGRGAYFAELAAYSHNCGYRHKMPSGRFQMFACRVLAGKAEERNAFSDATSRQIVHPARSYHSVHGPVRDGAPGGGRYNAYILYEKHRCYPEYLITYTK
mmetsp:Transcript_33319/g.87356  ORF Transcript_33319/g.87356 Transcript_33319/m.87356 type:complete len:395 (-) Transcript_33319:200-1384(-)